MIAMEVGWLDHRQKVCEQGPPDLIVVAGLAGLLYGRTKDAILEKGRQIAAHLPEIYSVEAVAVR